MSSEEEERLLSHSEVKGVLVSAMDKPDRIYEGPEEDIGMSRSTVPLGDEPEIPKEELDPEAKLSFEKRSTLEHVSQFSRIDHEKAEKMIGELTKIERITIVHAYKIAEIMPRDETELRPVFAKDRFTLEPEELSNILETIDKYRE